MSLLPHTARVMVVASTYKVLCNPFNSVLEIWFVTGPRVRPDNSDCGSRRELSARLAPAPFSS